MAKMQNIIYTFSIDEYLSQCFKEEVLKKYWQTLLGHYFIFAQSFSIDTLIVYPVQSISLSSSIYFKYLMYKCRRTSWRKNIMQPPESYPAHITCTTLLIMYTLWGVIWKYKGSLKIHMTPRPIWYFSRTSREKTIYGQ